MKLLCIGAICLALSPLAVPCQAATAPLAFEVASVKPAPAQKGPGIRVGISQDKGRVTMSNVTIKNLLTQAYKVKEHQLTTPDWMDNQRYDIVAKLPEGATKEQVPEMIQTLLAERFKLTMHRESKVIPIYALVPAKGGFKLHEADGEEGGLRMMMSPKGRQMEGKTTLSRLADSLSNSMDRPVLDMTEIKGVFDIDLTWTPDETDRLQMKFAAMGARAPEHGPDGGGEKSSDADAPNIFTALQEKMGLKLDPRKAPADIIVVDNAEKVPTEN